MVLYGLMMVAILKHQIHFNCTNNAETLQNSKYRKQHITPTLTKHCVHFAIIHPYNLYLCIPLYSCSCIIYSH